MVFLWILFSNSA